MKSMEITKFGDFGNPRKVLWSPFHSLFIVMGRQTLYSHDHVLGIQKPFYGSDSREFTDMDVSPEGYVVLADKSISSVDTGVRMFHPNLFSMVGQVNANGRKIRKVLFVSNKVAVSASDSDNGGQYADTFFDFMQPSKPVVSLTPSVYDQYNRKGTMGPVVAISKSMNSTDSFVVTSGGETLVISGDDDDLSSYKVKPVGDLAIPAISSASVIPGRHSVSNDPQSKVRIFVGSREGLNDMWDSGEVFSSSGQMPYGGGDNLRPGYRYWVHIMTFHQGSGWSRPQVKSFVMPKE